MVKATASAAIDQHEGPVTAMPDAAWLNPALLAALALAVVALTCGLIGWRAAAHARRAAQAAANAAAATRDGMLSANMTAMLDEYRSPAMKQALEIVARGAREEGRAFAAKFAARELGDAFWPVADNARRLIYWHYRKCFELAQAKLLPESFMTGFIQSSGGYGLFVHVVAPMAADTVTGASRESWIARMEERWPPAAAPTALFKQPLAA
jgi:hypothetical protein